MEKEIERLQVAYKLLQEQYNTDMHNKHEFIIMLENRHREELNKKDNIIKELKKELELLHYAIKGACAEHLHLRIEISPLEMAQSKDSMELARFMLEHGNREMAHAVEQQLGDRYKLIKEYDRALRHIFYLENHMSANCVKFTPFGVREQFR